jgi:hypothetical protein
MARCASIRRDRGRVDDEVPASLRNPSPAAKPNRTSARDAPLIDGSRGTSCGMARTRWGALRDIRIPRSTALRRAMPTLPVARYLSPPCTSFELQRLVPKARSCFSISATLSPRVAASSAMPAPVMPPPITMTSTFSPSASAASSVARRGLLSAVDPVMV